MNFLSNRTSVVCGESHEVIFSNMVQMSFKSKACCRAKPVTSCCDSEENTHLCFIVSGFSSRTQHHPVSCGKVDCPFHADTIDRDIRRTIGLIISCKLVDCLSERAPTAAYSEVSVSA